MLVGRSITPLMAGDFRLEVVVIGFLGQSCKHLHPGSLLHEHPKGIVSPGKLLDSAFTEQIRESLFQGFEMASDSGPDHDAAGIDGLAVLAVALSGADRTEETVFGENPHGSYSSL